MRKKLGWYIAIQATTDFLCMIITLNLYARLFGLFTYYLNQGIEFLPWFDIIIALILASLNMIAFLAIGAYLGNFSPLNIGMEVKVVTAEIYFSISLVILLLILRQPALIVIKCLPLIAIMPVIALASRRLSQTIISKLKLRGILRTEKVIIYDNNTTGQKLAKYIREIPELGIETAGFIKSRIRQECDDVQPIKKSTLELSSEFAASKKISRLFVTVPDLSADERNEIVEKCGKIDLDYSFVAGAEDLVLHSLHQESIGGIPFLSTDGHSPRIMYRVLKRIFDVCFSVSAMILAIPIWIVLTLMIKFDSNGPVIFRQERVGWKGRHFTMYKFRTMHVDTNKYDYSPISTDDPRMTKVGRVLRKISLDEMPQFINVLFGNMSVVGPRPEMPFIVGQYNATQGKRLEVKPGITGLWQISPYRSSLIHENMEYDLYYIYHKSFIMDLIIVLKTFIFAVKGI